MQISNLLKRNIIKMPSREFKTSQLLYEDIKKQDPPPIRHYGGLKVATVNKFIGFRQNIY